MRARWTYILAILAVAGSATISAQTDIKTQDFEFAQRLFKDKLYEMAAKQFEQFIVNYPNHRHIQEASRLVAEAYYQNGQYLEAAKLFDRYSRNYPDDNRLDDILLKTAECYDATAHPEQAARTYLRLTRLFPKSTLVTTALIRAGRALLKAEQYAEAADLLKRFAADYGRSDLVPEALFLEADARIVLRQYEDALKVLARLEKSYPSSAFTARGMFRRAGVLHTLSRNGEALQVLTRFVKKHPSSEVVPAAVLLLAEVQGLQKEYSAAITLLEKNRARYEGTEKDRVLLMLAEAYRQTDAPDTARTLFSRVLESASDSAEIITARWGLARSLLAARRQLEAISEIKLLLKEYPDAGITREAHLLLADIYRQQGRFNDAGETYLEYLKRYHPPRDEYVAVVKKTAEIYGNNVPNVKRLIEVYGMLITDHPNHPFADEARFRRGLCYEQLEEYDAAIAAYRELVQTYGLIEIGRRADERKRYIEEFKQASYKDAMRHLFSLLTSLLGQQDDPAALLRLGKIHYRDMKDYTRAVEAFTLFTQKAPDSTRAEGLFYLAQSRYQLAHKARLEQDEKEYTEQMAACRQTCDTILTTYAESEWSDDVALLLMEEELSSIGERTEAALDRMLKQYRSFLENHKNSDKLDRILLQIAQVYLEKGRAFRAADLDQAIQFCDRLIDHFGDSPLVAEAHYYKGEALYHQKAYAEAEAVLSKIIEQWPDFPMMVRVVFYLANSLFEAEKYQPSIDLYRSLINNYPASRFVTEARVRAGYAYSFIGDREKGAALLEQVKDSYDDEGMLLFTLAEDYSLLKKYDKAIAAYLAYLRDYTGRASEAVYALALLYLDRGDPDAALEQLTRYVETYPTHAKYYDALVALCRLAFERKQYGKAYVNYEKLAPMETDGEKRRRIEEQMAVCLYRQDDLTKARLAVEAFRKKHKKATDSRARFKKEEADHFLRKEKVKRARETYQEVIDEFERSSWADDALFGVAHTHFTEKSYNEALDALQTYIRKYPKGRHIADAYLHTASIQFINKDMVQAAKNFNRVISLAPDTENARNAAYNLILVNEKMEKYDAGIDAARYYLEHFPDSENADRVRIKEAIFLMAWDRYEQAMEKFERIREHTDDPELDSEVSFWIGECLFSLGRYEQAVEAYLRLVYFGKGKMMWKVTAEYKAGMAYEKLGKAEEAKKIYKYMTLHYGIASEWGRAAAQRLKVLKD